MPAKFRRETPRSREGKQSAARGWIRRTAEECGKRIVEDYRRETEKMKKPPDPAVELLRGGLSWRRLARSG
jgi:hypothetical protein